MSLAILQTFTPWSGFLSAAAPRPAKAAEARTPRPCPREIADEAAPARSRAPSLFHRWAAADLAARDLAFPLFLNPPRR